MSDLECLAARIKVFVARINAEPRHPLAASHYWCKFFPRLDPMHVNDHRGVISIAAGSLLLKLVKSCTRLGRTQQLRLDKLNEMMKGHQSKHNTEHRMPSLRLQDLTANGWGCLSGRIVKAANTRAMLPFLDSLAKEFFPDHGRLGYNSSIRKVMASLVEIQKIFYSSGHFISDANKQQLNQHYNRFARHWQNLRHLSSNAGENFFQITPKVHYSLHFVEQSQLLNPTSTQCYGEESLIGRVAKIWRACASGPYHATIQQTTLNRYWVGLELRVSLS